MAEQRELLIGQERFLNVMRLVRNNFEECLKVARNLLNVVEKPLNDLRNF